MLFDIISTIESYDKLLANKDVVSFVITQPRTYQYNDPVAGVVTTIEAQKGQEIQIRWPKPKPIKPMVDWNPGEGPRVGEVVKGPGGVIWRFQGDKQWHPVPDDEVNEAMELCNKERLT